MDEIAEAVKKCMAEDDLEETGLRKAAYAAHTKGEKMFTFKGKTYPVKVQGEDVSYGEAVKEEADKDLDARNKEIKDAKQKVRGEIIAQKAAMKSKTQKEETEIDEAISGEVTKTKTGLVHRSTKAYGGSKPEKHVVDTLKGPKTKDLMKQDKEAEMKTRGKYDEEMEFKNKLIEALKGQQHKIDKNKNKKIDAQDFAILRGQQKEEVEIDEASCEDEVKKHEKKMHGKDGEVAKHVEKMHKEEIEQIEEKNVPTSPEKWARAKAAAKAKFDVYPSAYANGWASKKYKAMGGGWKSVSEETEELDEKAGYSAKAARAGKDIGKPGKAFSMIAKKAGERYGSAEAGKRVAGAILAKLRKEEAEADWTEEQADALIEYYELEEREMTSAEMKKREDIVKGMKKSLAGFKARYGKDAKSVMYATATKQAMKEDTIEEKADPKVRTKDTLKGQEPTKQMDDVGPGSDGKSTKIKIEQVEEAEQPKKNQDVADKSYLKTAGKKPGSLHNVGKGLKAFIQGKKEPMESVEVDGSMVEGKRPESDTVPFITDEQKPPFEGPYTKTPKTVTDKSGAKHTPMSRARDLARQAMKRIKTEMLGKAPGNNG